MSAQHERSFAGCGFGGFPALVHTLAAQAIAIHAYFPVRRNVEFHTPKAAFHIDVCIAFAQVGTPQVDAGTSQTVVDTCAFKYFVQHYTAHGTQRVVRAEKSVFRLALCIDLPCIVVAISVVDALLQVLLVAFAARKPLAISPGQQENAYQYQQQRPAQCGHRYVEQLQFAAK